MTLSAARVPATDSVSGASSPLLKLPQPLQPYSHNTLPDAVKSGQGLNYLSPGISGAKARTTFVDIDNATWSELLRVAIATSR